MRIQRRISSKVTPVLERLDHRVLPAVMNPMTMQLLNDLRPQLQQSSRGLTQSTIFTGIERQILASSGLSPRRALIPAGVGVAIAGQNLVITRSNSGTGAVGMARGFGLNHFRDFGFGREPVVVGLQGPGIGDFTNDLSIQFRQGSAQAARPFNAVPGAGATFGIAFL